MKISCARYRSIENLYLFLFMARLVLDDVHGGVLTASWTDGRR